MANSHISQIYILYTRLITIEVCIFAIICTNEQGYANGQLVHNLIGAEPLATCGRRPAFDRRQANASPRPAPTPKAPSRPTPPNKNLTTKPKPVIPDWSAWYRKHFPSFWTSTRPIKYLRPRKMQRLDDDPLDSSLFAKTTQFQRINLLDIASVTGQLNSTTYLRLIGGDISLNNSKSAHVVGGRPSVPGQFPSYIKMIFGYWSYKSRGAECAATLVGPRTAISAAHCLEGVADISWVKIMVGINSPGRSAEKIYGVKRMCRLNRYCLLEEPSGRVPMWDVMIIELNKSIEYNDYVQPACVPFDFPPALRATTEDVFESAGLGLINKVGQAPYTIMYTKFRRKCPKNDYSKYNAAVECYMGVRGSHTCGGDSGGPLYYYKKVNGETRQFLSGTTSFGAARCQIGPNDNYFGDLDQFERYMGLLKPECPQTFGVRAVKKYC